MKTGIFKDPFDIYNKEPHLRASVVKEMQKSPGHYLNALNTPHTDSSVFDEGTVVHSVLLEQSTDGYIRRPDDIDGRTKAGKEKLDALKATGKIVLPGEVFDSLEKRLGTFCGSQKAMEIYNGADIETSHYAKDTETGFFIKARPDIVKPGIIADFKTTSFMPKFDKDIWTLGYFIQVGFYALTLKETTGSDFESFYFIAQEKKAPYGVQVFRLGAFEVNFAKQKARDLLTRVAICTQENTFPIYSDVVHHVEVPSWFLANDTYQEEVG